MQVQTDATCVRVLSSEKLLLAIGNQLVLLHVDGSGLTQRQPVHCLPRLKDTIHGIDYRRIEPKAGEPYWLIVVHAGREAYSMVLGKGNTFSQLHQILLYNDVAGLLYYPQDKVLLTHAPRRLNDWISTLKLLGENSACLITGHGVAVHLCQNYAGDWIISEQCPCEDGSTLYCSQIVGSSWKDLLCFSGTALGLLVIWRPSGPQKGQILYSISAHKGVVFSIECDLERNFLTTTSDDRSVKFWRMTMPDDGNAGVELKEISYCFGHTARVFQSRIIRGTEANWVVSIGEDSNICLWDESGNLVHKQRLEDGATLWNMDYDAATMTVFVCASNGNLSKFCIGQFLESNEGQQEAQDITPDLNGDLLTKVKFRYDGSILAVTKSNRILLLQASLEPEVVDHLVQFKCSIFEVSNDRIFVAGDRLLNIYDLDQWLSNPSCSPKTRKLSDFGEKLPSTALTKHLELDFNRQEFAPETEEIKFSIIRSLHVCKKSDVILCDNNGRCLIYDQNVETLKSCHRLPKGSERWLTFAFRLDQFLLLADRNGNLYLFTECQTDPIFKLPFLHGKLGVTHVQLEEETPEGCFLATTGHDGHVKSIFFDRVKLRLQVYEERKAGIRWIDRICIANRLIMGFNDSHFVVARDEQDVLLTVDCGGGHRYWDFLLSDDGHGFRFVFIKHKRLMLVASSRLGGTDSSNRLQVPRLCWHTKACNVVRIVRQGGAVLFVSGGEDNVLRINRFCAESGTLQDLPRKHLHCHISSIKTICLSAQLTEPGKVLILSAGGRAQLCLTTLDPSKPERTKEELSYMLLATDSDRSRWRTNRTASLDPETRFMCAVLVESESSSASSMLFIGCSDGFLRQFTVMREQDCYKVVLVGEVHYGRCLLHITKLSIGTRMAIVTMATDGLVCFWDSGSLTEPFYKLKHHDSGINAFDLEPLDNGGRFMIGTGSDDQTIAVTRFQCSVGNGKMFINRQNTVISNGLHIGQVTGVRLNRDGTLWSAGVDQRVYLLDFSGWRKMIVLKELRTCVADVKGLELIPESRCLFVYGWGYEFIDLRT